MRTWIGLLALAGCGGGTVEPLTADEELALSALTGREEELTRSAMLQAGPVAVDQPTLFRPCTVDGTHAGILALYDANGDGVIARDEEPAVWDPRAERDDCELVRRAHLWRGLTLVYDDNGNGDLGKAEKAHLFEDFTARCAVLHDQLLAEHDTDGDGLLSDTELAAIDAQIDSCHADGPPPSCADRPPGPPGVLAGLRSPPDLPPPLVAFDTDGDGALSDAERAAVQEAIRTGAPLVEPGMGPMGPPHP